MVYQNDLSLADSGQNTTDRISVFSYLTTITGSTIEELQHGSDPERLHNSLGEMVVLIKEIWQRVQSGELSTNDMAILRSICCVTCPEIESQLNSSEIDRKQLARELQLMQNTLRILSDTTTQ